MRKRKYLLLFALAAALLALGAAIWLFWPRTAITRENAALIQVGMTLAEVEAILGGPARDATTGSVVLDRSGDRPDDLDLQAALYEHRLVAALRSQAAGVGRPVEWRSNEVTILVLVDCNGSVTECSSIPRRRANESLIAMLRRWLRL